MVDKKCIDIKDYENNQLTNIFRGKGFEVYQRYIQKYDLHSAQFSMP